MTDDRERRRLERQARRRGSRERSVYSRRRLFALGALVAAVALVVGAVAAIRGLRNGGEAQVAS